MLYTWVRWFLCRGGDVSMVMKGTEERGNCCRFSVVTCWCVFCEGRVFILFIYLFLGDNILFDKIWF